MGGEEGGRQDQVIEATGMIANSAYLAWYVLPH